MDDTNQTREYLEGFARRHADVYLAKVVERLPNDVYRVEQINTGAKTLAKADTGSFFMINEWVYVESAAASGNVVGSMDRIVSRAPQRGLSETTPSARTETVTRAFIISVEPEPLVLTAGAGEETQIITGSGLVEAASYINPAGDPQPILISAEAPDVADDRIEMNLRAGGLSAVGEFTLLTSGARVPKALRILPADPDPLLLVPGARLRGVWPEYGTIVRESALLPTAARRVFAEDRDLIVAFDIGTGGGATLANTKLKALARIDPPFFPSPNEFCQIADDGNGFLWYASGANLVCVDIANGSHVTVATSAMEFEGVAYDAAHDAVFACDTSTVNVLRFDRESRTVTDTLPAPLTFSAVQLQPRNLLVIDDTLHVFCAGLTSGAAAGYYRLSTASLAVTGGRNEVPTSGHGVRPVGLAVNYRGIFAFPTRRDDSDCWLFFARFGDMSRYDADGLNDVCAAGIVGSDLAVVDRNADSSALRTITFTYDSEAEAFVSYEGRTIDDSIAGDAVPCVFVPMK